MSGNRAIRPRAAAKTLQRWGFAVAAVASVATAQISVPPAEYRPAEVSRKAEPAPALLLPHSAAVRHIALPQPTAAESAAPKALPQTSPAKVPARNKSSRLALGFARAVPAAERSLALADLPW